MDGRYHGDEMQDLSAAAAAAEARGENVCVDAARSIGRYRVNRYE